MEGSSPAQPPASGPPATPPASGPYPVRAHAERQQDYNRFLPLVKWLLALPHYVVLALLGIGALVAIVISFFAVIITRRYPRALFDFVVGVYRWAFRVSSYVLLLNDRYPPFSLGDDPAYPARLELEYPEEIDRWRPLVQWLLIIPYAIVAGILRLLAGVVALFGVFVILFTRRLPEGIFELILIPIRWQLRANAYGSWLLTRYPPFRWE